MAGNPDADLIQLSDQLVAEAGWSDSQRLRRLTRGIVDINPVTDAGILAKAKAASALHTSFSGAVLSLSIALSLAEGLAGGDHRVLAGLELGRA